MSLQPTVDPKLLETSTESNTITAHNFQLSVNSHLPAAVLYATSLERN